MKTGTILSTLVAVLLAAVVVMDRGRIAKLEAEIAALKSDGFRVREIKYLFDESNVDLETKLSLQAINDAKRKATALCKQIDMRLGKILNIEVKEATFGSSQAENKNKATIKTYKVAITFKLID